MTDIEGVSGVDRWDTHRYDTLEQMAWKQEMVGLLTGEVNAAVEGAVTAGATEVWVNDGHGNGRNLAPEEVHPAANLIRGVGRPAWLPGLTEHVDSFLFIGQHAMQGTAGAVLPHSWSRRHPRKCYLNGREIGEIGAAMYLAASLGVAPVFLSGDRSAVEEARAIAPAMECVAVKQGLSEQSALHMSPDRARSAIRDGVEKALRKRHELHIPVLPGPYIFRQVFLSPPWRGIAFGAAHIFGQSAAAALLRMVRRRLPGDRVRVEAVNRRTLQYRGESLAEVLESALGVRANRSLPSLTSFEAQRKVAGLR